MSSKDSFALIDGTCKHVTSYDKRDLARMLNSGSSGMGRLFWIIQVGLMKLQGPFWRRQEVMREVDVVVKKQMLE